jgi:hypothetical protein
MHPLTSSRSTAWAFALLLFLLALNAAGRPQVNAATPLSAAEVESTPRQIGLDMTREEQEEEGKCTSSTMRLVPREQRKALEIIQFLDKLLQAFWVSCGGIECGFWRDNESAGEETTLEDRTDSSCQCHVRQSDEAQGQVAC